MSRCSSIVFRVNGIVGLVDDGRTFGSPQTRMMSGRVPAAGAFGVVGVNRPAFERRDGVFDEAGLVEGVGMDRDLNVELFGDAEALIDGRRRRSPVLVKLQTERAGANLFAQRLRKRRVPFPRKPKLSGKASAASYIRRIFQAPECRWWHWFRWQDRCRRRSGS